MYEREAATSPEIITSAAKICVCLFFGGSAAKNKQILGNIKFDSLNHFINRDDQQGEL